VRTAQASVGQAQSLFAAIEEHASELAEAGEKLTAAVADTHSDITAARALDKGGAPPVSTAVAAAEAALATVDPKSPLSSLGQVEKANTELDAVFTRALDEQERVARAKSQLETSISTARAQISSTAQYITTRRGSIGETARTRISEADRHLATAIALAATDPVAALAAAQQANQLATTAMNIASNEVERYTSSSAYSDSSYDGGGTGLGGILGDLIFGGESSGGGGGIFGGGSGGGWSGGSRSGRSSYSGSSRSRSSGFGGSSRSSGGSRSRSSGGRSRGGRF
jgi:hypothetical protein